MGPSIHGCESHGNMGDTSCFVASREIGNGRETMMPNKHSHTSAATNNSRRVLFERRRSHKILNRDVVKASKYWIFFVTDTI